MRGQIRRIALKHHKHRHAALTAAGHGIKDSGTDDPEVIVAGNELPLAENHTRASVSAKSVACAAPALGSTSPRVKTAARTSWWRRGGFAVKSLGTSQHGSVGTLRRVPPRLPRSTNQANLEGA